MFDACDQTAEFALIEAIAAALRAELGVAIAEQPASTTRPRPARSTGRSAPWPGPSSGRSSRRRTRRRS